ncbi:MAG: glycosyltransferase, partial [Rubrobacteraceae bacterium]
LELCLRIRKRGWTIRYAPEALVRHKGQGSVRKESEAFVDIDSALNPNYPFYLYHRTKNRMLTTAIHARGADAARFLLFYPAVLSLTCTRAARRGRWDGIRAVFAGIRDFVPEIRQPFVDELKQENPGKAPPKRKPDDDLRVAVVEPVGGHGGMGYYDFGLCGGLAEAGVEVSLYTCDETVRDTAKPYEIRLPYRGIYGKDPAWLRGLRYLRGSARSLLGAKLGRARIAHFHFFHVGPLELFNVLLAKLLGTKVVVTAHDARSFVESLSVPWMSKTAYRAADGIIAQSEVSRRELVSVLGEPEGKIDAIPHGNYLPFIGEVPSQADAKARIGVPAGAPVILFFGQIKSVKGLDVLIEAMPEFLRKHPDALLVVAGRVWKDDFRRYETRIEDLGISDNCVLHVRYVPDSEVKNYYAAADIVALPYRRIYQSGVLLMAMSYGKPAIVSDIAGMTEVVSDGINGYVFPSGDSKALAARLAAALSEPEELRLVGERALTHVRERNDWTRIGRMTADFYRSVVKG